MFKLFWTILAMVLVLFGLNILVPITGFKGMVMLSYLALEIGFIITGYLIFK